jgi:hypothetical protein
MNDTMMLDAFHPCKVSLSSFFASQMTDIFYSMVAAGGWLIAKGVL